MNRGQIHHRDNHTTVNFNNNPIKVVHQLSKEERQLDDSLDQSNNNYKEEFMNQLKLVEISLSSPSNHIQPITINLGFAHQEPIVTNDTSSPNPKQFIFENNNESEANKLNKVQYKVKNYLEDLVDEYKNYNYGSQQVVKNYKQSIGDEIIDFCSQLVEKKRNLPRTLHEIPTGTLGLQLNDMQSQNQDQITLKAKKEETNKDKNDFKDSILNEKLEWIRLKKKIEYITDLNPFTLNIEGIYTLPENIKIAEDDGTINKGNNPFLKDFRQEILDLKQIMGIKAEQSPKQKNQLNEVIDNIFKDSMELSTQMSTKDQIISYPLNNLQSQQIMANGSLNHNSNTQPSQQQTDPSHQSLTIMDQVEIIDINFYRDLAPQARQLAKPLIYNNNKKELKKIRKAQKKILNELIEIEPSQQNLDEDMYILALMIQRLNALSKWEIRDEQLINFVYGSKASLNQTYDSDEDENHLKLDDDSNKEDQRLADHKSSYSNIDQSHLNKQIQNQNKKEKTQKGSSTFAQAIYDGISDYGLQDDRSQKAYASKKNFKIEGKQNYKERAYSHQIDEIHKRNGNELLDNNERIEDYDNYEDNQDQNEILNKLFKKQKKKKNKQEKLQEETDFKIDQYNSQSQKSNYNQAQYNDQYSAITSNNYQSNQDEENSISDDLLQTLKEKEDSKKQTMNIQIQNDQQQLADQQPQLNKITVKESTTTIETALEECENLINERLKQIEELKEAKNQIDIDSDKIRQVKKQINTNSLTQSLKNNERMKAQIKKRIESHLEVIIQILDQKTQEIQNTLNSSVEIKSQILSTQTILRATQIAEDNDIDEQLKAKYIARLVREFCTNRERAKQNQLKQQFEDEIEKNIYNRFPGLGLGQNSGSPESVRNTTNQYGTNKSKKSNTVGRSEISPVKMDNYFSHHQHGQQVEAKIVKKNQMDLFEIQEIKQKPTATIRQGYNNSNNSKYDYQKKSQQQLRPPPLVKVNHFSSSKKNKNPNSNINKNENKKSQQHKKSSSINHFQYASQKNIKKMQNLQPKLSQNNLYLQQDDMPPQSDWIGNENDLEEHDDYMWTQNIH